MYQWDAFLEEADSDAPAQWLGTIQADSQAQAISNAAQLYECAEYDIIVERQPTSAQEWDEKAIEKAKDQAPQDMILTPVEATSANLFRKQNVVGADLAVQGMRWYVEVDLVNLNDQTTAAALYRVWHEQGQWKAVRVELI